MHFKLSDVNTIYMKCATTRVVEIYGKIMRKWQWRAILKPIFNPCLKKATAMTNTFSIPKSIRSLALTFCLALSSSGILAQTVISSSLNLSDTTQMHQLQTQQGDRLVGRVVSMSGTQIDFLLQASGEVIPFALADVAFVGLLHEGRNTAKRTRSDRNSYVTGEELFYSATGFLPEGKGVYRNTMLLYNSVDFRLGKYASLGGGFIVPFILMAKAKISIPVKSFIRVGVASTNYLLLGLDDGGASQLQGIVTLGERERHISFGAGYIFDLSLNERYPAFSMGGSYTFNERNRLYAELGYYYDRFESFVLPTLQYSLLRGRNKFDLGLIGVPSDVFFAIPTVSYYRMF